MGTSEVLPDTPLTVPSQTQLRHREDTGQTGQTPRRHREVTVKTYTEDDAETREKEDTKNSMGEPSKHSFLLRPQRAIDCARRRSTGSTQAYEPSLLRRRECGQHVVTQLQRLCARLPLPLPHARAPARAPAPCRGPPSARGCQNQASKHWEHKSLRFLSCCAALRPSWQDDQQSPMPTQRKCTSASRSPVRRGEQHVRQSLTQPCRKCVRRIRVHGGAKTRRRSTGSTKPYESSEDSAAAPPSDPLG